MTAIDREFVTIYIKEQSTSSTGVDGSDLADSDAVNGEITSHNLTGGNQDVETVAAFGGFIDKRKPREQFEISMDVVPKLSGVAGETDRWDIFKYGATGKSSAEGSAYTICVEATDGTNAKTSMFKNCKLTNWEPSHSADDNYSGTATWKFSPTDDVDAANLATSALEKGDAFFTWA